MLLQFTVENYKSFRDKQEFSLFATSERQHGQYLSRPLSYLPRILPIAALYGANASGKSNFFKAIAFVKKYITQGHNSLDPIPIKPFKLDANYNSKASSFSIMILIDKTVYELTFSLSAHEVEYEKLSILNSSGEKIVYERHLQDIQLHNTLQGADIEHLKFIIKSTRNNQLFLSTCHQLNQSMGEIIPWLIHNLVLITPDTTDSSLGAFAEGSHTSSAQFNSILQGLDTHISNLALVKQPPEQIGLPTEIIKPLIDTVSKSNSTGIFTNPKGDRYTIDSRDGEVNFNKIVAIHPFAQGGEIEFDLIEESDGTRRIIDLLPSLLSLSDENSHKVLIIDELDRSLHPHMTRHFVNLFLNNCDNNTRSQLIFSTHDVMLFTQEIFRRDELWLVEKDDSGSSCMYSVAEFKDKRYDEVIRKSYLSGRMGGIPHLF